MAESHNTAGLPTGSEPWSFRPSTRLLASSPQAFLGGGGSGQRCRQGSPHSASPWRWRCRGCAFIPLPSFHSPCAFNGWGNCSSAVRALHVHTKTVPGPHTGFTSISQMRWTGFDPQDNFKWPTAIWWLSRCWPPRCSQGMALAFVQKHVKTKPGEPKTTSAWLHEVTCTLYIKAQCFGNRKGYFLYFLCWLIFCIF